MDVGRMVGGECQRQEVVSLSRPPIPFGWPWDLSEWQCVSSTIALEVHQSERMDREHDIFRHCRSNHDKGSPSWDCSSSYHSRFDSQHKWRSFSKESRQKKLSNGLIVATSVKVKRIQLRISHLHGLASRTTVDVSYYSKTEKRVEPLLQLRNVPRLQSLLPT